MFTLCLQILMEWLAQVKTQVQVHVSRNFHPNTPFHAHTSDFNQLLRKHGHSDNFEYLFKTSRRRIGLLV
jgi:hypothetical protein